MVSIMRSEQTLRLIQLYHANYPEIARNNQDADGRTLKLHMWARITEELNSAYESQFTVEQFKKKVQNVQCTSRQKLYSGKRNLGEAEVEYLRLFERDKISEETLALRAKNRRSATAALMGACCSEASSPADFLAPLRDREDHHHRQRHQFGGSGGGGGSTSRDSQSSDRGLLDISGSMNEGDMEIEEEEGNEFDADEKPHPAALLLLQIEDELGGGREQLKDSRQLTFPRTKQQNKRGEEENNCCSPTATIMMEAAAEGGGNGGGDGLPQGVAPTEEQQLDTAQQFLLAMLNATLNGITSDPVVGELCCNAPLPAGGVERENAVIGTLPNCNNNNSNNINNNRRRKSSPMAMNNNCNGNNDRPQQEEGGVTGDEATVGGEEQQQQPTAKRSRKADKPTRRTAMAAMATTMVAGEQQQNNTAATIAAAGEDGEEVPLAEEGGWQQTTADSAAEWADRRKQSSLGDIEEGSGQPPICCPSCCTTSSTGSSAVAPVDCHCPPSCSSSSSSSAAVEGGGNGGENKNNSSNDKMPLKLNTGGEEGDGDKCHCHCQCRQRQLRENNAIRSRLDQMNDTLERIARAVEMIAHRIAPPPQNAPQRQRTPVSNREDETTAPAGRQCP